MKKLTGAVIGAGMMGGLHSRTIVENPSLELAYIMDISKEAGEKLAKERNAQYTDNLDIVYTDPNVDFVVICLPDQLHVDATLKAIEHKKHILLEKPLATTLEDGETLCKAVEGYDKKVTVGHLLRYDPRFAQAKAAIKRGDIGEIIHMSAKRNNTLAGAYRLGGRTTILCYLAIHDVDMLCWLADEEPANVYTVGNRKALEDIKTEDVYLSVMKFKSGIVASLEHTWCLPDGLPGRLNAGVQVVGTKGALWVDSTNTDLLWATKDKTYSPDTFHWPVVNGKLVGDIREEMNSFTESIMNDTEPVVSFKEANRALRVVQALTDSFNTGEIVSL